MAGTEDKIKGQFNETKGKVTNDTSEEMKGKAQQTEGSAKNTAQDLKDKVSNNT